MRRNHLITCFWSCFFILTATKASSQLGEQFDFRKYLAGKPVLKSYSGLDSVYTSFTHSYNHAVDYNYIGQLNNGLPEGFGTYMAGKQVLYSGEWKNGVPDGNGNFFAYIPGAMQYKFRGEFKNGYPVNGLVAYMDDASSVPKLFYSGDVTFFPDVFHKIVPHGYGRMYASTTMQAYAAAPGSYQEGQFFYGQPTGFGIYNKIPKDNIGFTSLQIGLLLCGLEINRFNDLRIDAIAFENKTDLARSDSSPVTVLLPYLSKTVYDSMIFDRNATYYGMVYKGLPYGPGTIVYKDGYRDAGFWKNGEQVPTRNLLAALLPDSSVLQPVMREEFHPVMKLAYNRKTKNQEWEMVREKRQVRYYAPWVNGKPSGYGWKEDTTMRSVAVAAYFSGESKEKEWNADTSFAQVYPTYAKSLGYIMAGPATQFFRSVTVQSYMVSYYPASFSRKGMVAQFDYTRYNPYPEQVHHPTVAFTEPRIGLAAYKDYLVKLADKRAAFFHSIYSKPRASIFSVSYYPNDISRTEVKTTAGTLKGEMMDVSQIKMGDVVLLSGGKFDNAAADKQAPPSAHGSGGRYYVIRNYQISEMVSEYTCKACNGTGGSSSYRSIDIASGYSASVNYSLSGYSNGAVVYTPKYTSVGSYKVKDPCNVCRGNAYSKTNTTKIEIKY